MPGPRIVLAVVVGARDSYFTPEFHGIKKILLGFMGLGALDGEDKNPAMMKPPEGLKTGYTLKILANLKLNRPTGHQGLMRLPLIWFNMGIK